ncbi:hypothetical protein LSH36_13g02114 [Paralvinella palmiformis]|uniref:MULE transposase domain-containing protein n=1 Tax=Paralvinella palmiformis TaxID=53620 RepID=A0AAD9KDU5_9ANNE|nr:hypothetical protein LSH36_13g02114 [Paralvinella palmiformis]
MTRSLVNTRTEPIRGTSPSCARSTTSILTQQLSLTTTRQAITSIPGEHLSTQGCFYHLTQSTWRKVQELGVSNAYHAHDEVRTFVGMIDSFAFLPVDRVSDGMQHLRSNIPEYASLDDLLNYFDTVYVTGTYRRVRSPED